MRLTVPSGNSKSTSVRCPEFYEPRVGEKRRSRGSRLSGLVTAIHRSVQSARRDGHWRALLLQMCYESNNPYNNFDRVYYNYFRLQCRFPISQIIRGNQRSGLLRGWETGRWSINCTRAPSGGRRLWVSGLPPESRCAVLAFSFSSDRSSVCWIWPSASWDDTNARIQPHAVVGTAL